MADAPGLGPGGETRGGSSPSGRTQLNGGHITTRVVINPNGPIRIEGDFSMVDVEGTAFGLGGRSAITLCRCGHSTSKPFCDGAHAREGFREPAVARDLPPRPQR
jgi:CDGSH-type Zn-finger protein